MRPRVRIARSFHRLAVRIDPVDHGAAMQACIGEFATATTRSAQPARDSDRPG